MTQFFRKRGVRNLSFFAIACLIQVTADWAFDVWPIDLPEGPQAPLPALVYKIAVLVDVPVIALCDSFCSKAPKQAQLEFFIAGSAVWFFIVVLLYRVSQRILRRFT